MIGTTKVLICDPTSYTLEVPKLSSGEKSSWRAVIVINPKDNVCVALKDLEKGMPLQVEVGSNKLEITSLNPILFGHKIALRNITKGEDVIKYGEVIGRATRDIEIGEHVHVHNVESQRGRGDL